MPRGTGQFSHNAVTVALTWEPSFERWVPAQASDRAYRKRRSGSAGITNPSTRPLATKIETLMGYIIGALCRYWELETCSTPELIDHIAAVSATMWKWGKRTEDSFRTNKNLKFLVMESHE